MQLREQLYMYPWTDLRENNCNTYLVDGPVRTLIDPGHLHLLPQLETGLRADGFSFEDIELVIATHPHPDHCEGLLTFKDFGTKVAMHQEAERFLATFKSSWEAMTGNPVPELQIDFYLQEGDLRLADKTIRIIDTPGHAPGSICLYWEEEKALFSGDVIFQQSVGRVDLPGGNLLALIKSIEKLMDYDIELLLPGHGGLLEGRGAVKENFYLVLQMIA